MMELKKLESWDCKIGFTALTVSDEIIKMALGCATTTALTHKTVPNKDLSQSDFTDLWWVGDMADGGFAAVKLLNALSTSGLSLQTTKNGKGTLACELTGHVSINAQDTMPIEFYVIPGTSGSTGTTGTTGTTGA